MARANAAPVPVMEKKDGAANARGKAGSTGKTGGAGTAGAAGKRTAVLASGDELVEVERYVEVLAGRRIVSSNSYALAAQLAEAGMEARALGIARDTPESLRAHLERARGCDALVTTAGISVGEHDHVRAVMEELRAEVAFWRVRARPGSALAFGRVGALGGIPWFGLPGNPVSAHVSFELFARPALLQMMGQPDRFRPVVDALRSRGDECLLVARDKDVTLGLLERQPPATADFSNGS